MEKKTLKRVNDREEGELLSGDEKYSRTYDSISSAEDEQSMESRPRKRRRKSKKDPRVDALLNQVGHISLYLSQLPLMMQSQLQPPLGTVQPLPVQQEVQLLPVPQTAMPLQTVPLVQQPVPVVQQNAPVVQQPVQMVQQPVPVVQQVVQPQTVPQEVVQQVTIKPKVETQNSMSFIHNTNTIATEDTPPVIPITKLPPAEEERLQELMQLQKFDQQSWKLIKYKKYLQEYYASPGFAGLKINEPLQNLSQDKDYLAQTEEFLAGLSNAVLEQRQLLRSGLQELVDWAASEPQNLNAYSLFEMASKIFGPRSASHRNSEDIMQIICGRRSECIEVRRQRLLKEIPDKNLRLTLTSIPPSAEHIFNEERLNAAIDSIGGEQEFFNIINNKVVVENKQKYTPYQIQPNYPVKKFNNAHPTNPGNKFCNASNKQPFQKKKPFHNNGNKKFYQKNKNHHWQNKNGQGFQGPNYQGDYQ